MLTYAKLADFLVSAKLESGSIFAKMAEFVAEVAYSRGIAEKPICPEDFYALLYEIKQNFARSERSFKNTQRLARANMLHLVDSRLFRFDSARYMGSLFYSYDHFCLALKGLAEYAAELSSDNNFWAVYQSHRYSCLYLGYELSGQYIDFGTSRMCAYRPTLSLDALKRQLSCFPLPENCLRAVFNLFGDVSGLNSLSPGELYLYIQLMISESWSMVTRFRDFGRMQIAEELGYFVQLLDSITSPAFKREFRHLMLTDPAGSNIVVDIPELQDNLLIWTNQLNSPATYWARMLRLAAIRKGTASAIMATDADYYRFCRRFHKTLEDKLQIRAMVSYGITEELSMLAKEFGANDSYFMFDAQTINVDDVYYQRTPDLGFSVRM